MSQNITNTTANESNPLPSSAEIFAKNWQMYQKIIENNHMRHQEMYDALHQFILNYSTESFSFLDLGCGDASTLTHCLIDSKIKSYTGVDLSPQALAIAQKNLACLPGEKTLITGNIKDIVKELITTKNLKFDVVFSSYAIHHLNTSEKQGLINDIWQILNPNSCFIFIDVFREEGETRESFLAKYWQNINENWLSLTKAEIEMAIQHMATCDFPETEKTIYQQAQNAGFSKFECVYRDQQHPGNLLVFYK